ncbi:O-methylsterigmatocystin oxidoreductase, putative [Rhizoctonia solani AG-3 Rhs1AP]|uniref:O-methylsterigmatocystin oxidoreductase, putative n=1 Tax=Rhizoctonia solani AG-3 Rhs1AP TaxID=1086054 RepID=X8JAN5_9AGAM|nr:O-methylsterigmatocystin oxidoreductase, putative [Rhizoctonia solani AG-3 Rhs1AP]
MADPNNFSLDIRRMAGSAILMAVYGYDVTSADDRLFKAVETAGEGFSQALAVPNYLVNTFPLARVRSCMVPGSTLEGQGQRLASSGRSNATCPIRVDKE